MVKTKTGIVMEIKDNLAYIMTQNGEFEKVKINNNSPSIGEIYTGEIYKKYNYIRYFVSAASIFLCLALGSGSYAYYKPVNSVIVKVDNIDTKIQVNRFNKIISVSTEETSNNVVKSLELKHKDLNDGLAQIVDASKGSNNENKLLVKIKTNNKDKAKLDIEKFKEDMKKKDIHYEVNKKNSKKKVKKVKVEKEKTIKNNVIKISSENSHVTNEDVRNNNIDKKDNNKNNTNNKNKNETNKIKNKVNKEDKETKNKKEDNKNNYNKNKNNDNKKINNSNRNND